MFCFFVIQWLDVFFFVFFSGSVIPEIVESLFMPAAKASILNTASDVLVWIDKNRSTSVTGEDISSLK